MIMTTFQIFKRNNGKHYYRIVTESGHNIMSSDGYVKKNDWLIAIDQVKEHILNNSSIRLKVQNDRKWGFTLSGSDRSIVGYSMSFQTKNQCDKWLSILKSYLPESKITELSTQTTW